MHDDFYQMYLEEMEDIVPCEEEETRELLKAVKEGREEAKKRLVEGNLQTALSFAKEFEGKGVLLTDLVQEANMALIMAVDQYSGMEDKAEFDGFAGDRIKKALFAAVKEEESAEQTGEELAARVNVLQQIAQGLAEELGREATVEELAHKMKMTVGEIQGIMKMAMDAVSLNAENMDLKDLADVEGIELIKDDAEEDADDER